MTANPMFHRLRVLGAFLFAGGAVTAASATGCVAACPPDVICVPGDATGGAGGTAGSDGSVGGGGSDGGGSGGESPSGSGGTGEPTYPTGEWQNVTSNLVGLDSECGNVSALGVKPDEDLLLVGIARQGIWGSRDGGQSWERMGQGDGSAVITNRTTRFIFDPSDTNTFWESGIYNDGGVYVTRDNGDTFRQLGDVTHTDLVSVDLSDPERKVLLAGGHETAGVLWKSSNGGETWDSTFQGIPDDMVCTIPQILDSSTYLVGCMSPRGAIYRSEDGGASWTEAQDYAGGGGSAPLWAKNGDLYWSSPVFNALGVGLSEDGGRTWKEAAETGFATPGTPIELPDGRIVVLGKDDAVQATDDKGKTWKPVTSKLPRYEGGESWLGVEYSVHQKAFFVWRFTCGPGNIPVHEESIMRYDFDFEAD